jgi:hypothetical protein
VLFQNNHFISASTATGCYAGPNAPLSCTFASSNVVQTLSTANAQGYKSSQVFAFAPTSSGNATVARGTALSAPTFGELATLASDTTYACALVSGNQVSCPKRATLIRGTAWDAGAYQFSATAISPPTNMNTAVH